MKSGGLGICVFTAAQHDERARATFTTKMGFSFKYSPFAIGLSRGFAGKGKGNKNGDQFVTSADLVTECTKWLGKHGIVQHPTMDYNGNRFVVGCYIEGAANNKEFPMLDDEIIVDLSPPDETPTPLAAAITTNNVTGTQFNGTTTNNVTGNQFNGTTMNAGFMDFSQNKSVNNHPRG